MSESKIEVDFKKDNSLTEWKSKSGQTHTSSTLFFDTDRGLPSDKILNISWCRAGQISLPDKKWEDFLAKIAAAKGVQTELLMTYNQFNLLSEIKFAQLVEQLSQMHFTSIDISNNKLSSQQLMVFLDGLSKSVTALTCDLKYALINPEADIISFVGHLPNSLRQLTITGSYTSQVVERLNHAISQKEDLDLVLSINEEQYFVLQQLDSGRPVAI